MPLITARQLLVTSKLLAKMKMFALLQHIKLRLIELNDDLKPSAICTQTMQHLYLHFSCNLIFK